MKLDDQTSVKWSLVTGALRLDAMKSIVGGRISSGVRPNCPLSKRGSRPTKSRARIGLSPTLIGTISLQPEGFCGSCFRYALACCPPILGFCYGAQGRPALDPKNGEASIQFNHSHIRNPTVHAFAQRRNLGIDMGQITPRFATDDIAQLYFSPVEYAELCNLP